MSAGRSVVVAAKEIVPGDSTHLRIVSCRFDFMRVNHRRILLPGRNCSRRLRCPVRAVESVRVSPVICVCREVRENVTLLIDQSAITGPFQCFHRVMACLAFAGESRPVQKHRVLAGEALSILFFESCGMLSELQHDKLYSGTIVRQGEAGCIVTETGKLRCKAFVHKQLL